MTFLYVFYTRYIRFNIMKDDFKFFDENIFVLAKNKDDALSAIIKKLEYKHTKSSFSKKYDDFVKRIQFEKFGNTQIYIAKQI